MTGCNTSSECNSAGGCGCSTLKQPKLTEPPSGRDMIRMIVSLTAVCVISAGLLGALFLVTEPVRLRNLAEREAKTLRTLLGLSEGARIEEIRRFQGNDLSSIYLTQKFLIHLDQQGEELQRRPAVSQKDAEETNAWVRSEFPQLDPKLVGRFFVGRNGEEILGYVIEGETQGYKSRVRFFTALSADFQIQGVEVLEQEDDPGLGAEMTQPYFKNQFAGRSAEAIASIQVSKDPLPMEWKSALEELGPTPFSVWVEKHGTELTAHPVIHAITGATISSDALTRGVKRAVGNFRRRLEWIKGAL